MKAKSAPDKQDNPIFSESLSQIETILNRFKNELLPLETAMSLFEKGMTEIKNCQAYLIEAKGKIQILSEEMQEQLSGEAAKKVDDSDLF